MRWRALAAAGLMATIAVSAIGCAGEDATVPSETMELPTPPPSEMPEVLDLEAMSDEELLAEARRSYQGFFNDIEEMREAGGSDYTSLTEWTQPEFASAYNESMNSALPDGYSVYGSQEILGMELTNDEFLGGEEVLVNVCVSNNSIQIFDASGKDTTKENPNSTATGEVQFQLSDDKTRLLIWSERDSHEGLEALCN
ncbi:MAG: hypothetical protein ACTIJ7_02050 [Agrococcus casei]|uniref:hypothetical protein n=1 Tax=Agrococcus casei TaxID=343512 RepID=UPI003F9CC552